MNEPLMIGSVSDDNIVQFWKMIYGIESEEDSAAIKRGEPSTTLVESQNIQIASQTDQIKEGIIPPSKILKPLNNLDQNNQNNLNLQTGI